MKPRSLMLFACAFATSAMVAWQRPPAASRAAVSPGPVIVNIVGRNHTVTIHSGDSQPRYTVHREGRLVADCVTLDQLKLLDLQAWKQIKSATAGGDTPTIWAGVE